LKSCFLLHYQKYGVFYAVPLLQKLKKQDLLAEIFKIAAISIFDELVSIVYTVCNE